MENDNKNKIDEEMSNTFVADVGQKSAIASGNSGFISSSEIASDLGNNKAETNMDFTESNTIKDVEELRNNNNRNPIPVIIAIIISLAIGILSTIGYYSIFKSNNTKEEKKTTVKKEQVKNKEIVPESLFIQKIIQRYDTDSIRTYKRLYSKDSVLVSDFDMDEIQELGVLNISNRDSDYFTTNQLQTSLDELFGSNIYSPAYNNIVVNSCDKYLYNSEKNTYTKQTVICKEDDFEILRKIVKAEQNDDNLYVNVAIAVKTKDENGNETIYKSYDLDKKTGEVLEDADVNTFDIESNYSKLIQYKYSFKYDQDNNNYYLSEIEKNR